MTDCKHVYIFEKVIESQSASVVENGVVLRSDGTGDSILFDREDPDFASTLRAFLTAQADAGIIFKSDVSLWHNFLFDDGRATVSTLERGLPATPGHLSVCDWQGYDFAGF